MEPRGELPPTDPKVPLSGELGGDRRAAHRSVEIAPPADGQVEVAAQAPDGHHPHVHRLDLQNTWRGRTGRRQEAGNSFTSSEPLR